jgi:hypothetical protein
MIAHIWQILIEHFRAKVAQADKRFGARVFDFNSLNRGIGRDEYRRQYPRRSE